MRFLFLIFSCFILLTACKARNSNAENTAEIENETVATSDPIRLMAEEIASSMENSLLAAQVLICGIDGRGNLAPHMAELLNEYPAGGVMLFRYNLNTDNDSIRNLLSQTTDLIKEKSGIAPFIAVDHEGGTVNRFTGGVATLPEARYYWELFLAEGKEASLEKLENNSFTAGQIIFDLGINMNFAPVAEQLTDDNFSFLQSRSYGPDPLFTAEASLAFLRGMEKAGVICVVKHFPGSAGPDPHYSPSVLNMDKPSLDSLVYPFSYLIKDGARAVMVAHSGVPALDDKIASLSQAVMGKWLREEMGFNGIIISDDFFMAAAGGMPPEEAAVHSVVSGADMILVWPQDLSRTHEFFLKSLENGVLSRERLVNAAQRIIYEKIRMNLISERENG